MNKCKAYGDTDIMSDQKLLFANMNLCRNNPQYINEENTVLEFPTLPKTSPVIKRQFAIFYKCFLFH